MSLPPRHWSPEAGISASSPASSAAPSGWTWSCSGTCGSADPRSRPASRRSCRPQPRRCERCSGVSRGSYDKKGQSKEMIFTEIKHAFYLRLEKTFPQSPQVTELRSPLCISARWSFRLCRFPKLFPQSWQVSSSTVTSEASWLTSEGPVTAPRGRIGTNCDLGG